MCSLKQFCKALVLLIWLLCCHFPALEKATAAHCSVLAWRTPGTGEPGGPPSMGSHRVGHDWSDLAAAAVAARVSVWKTTWMNEWMNLRRCLIVPCKWSDRSFSRTAHFIFNYFLCFWPTTYTIKLCKFSGNTYIVKIQSIYVEEVPKIVYAV